jgi:hypothetical protein
LFDQSDPIAIPNDSPMLSFAMAFELDILHEMIRICTKKVWVGGGGEGLLLPALWVDFMGRSADNGARSQS